MTAVKDKNAPRQTAKSARALHKIQTPTALRNQVANENQPARTEEKNQPARPAGKNAPGPGPGKNVLPEHAQRETTAPRTANTAEPWTRLSAETLTVAD